MKFNYIVRQTHRWLSIIFTLTVIIAMAANWHPAPPEWVYYLPLPPLLLMLLSGLYLFALPYLRKHKA